MHLGLVSFTIPINSDKLMAISQSQSPAIKQLVIDLQTMNFTGEILQDHITIWEDRFDRHRRVVRSWIDQDIKTVKMWKTHNSTKHEFLVNKTTAVRNIYLVSLELIDHVLSYLHQNK